MSVIHVHSALKLVHFSVDTYFPSVWERRFLIGGSDRSRILIRVFACHANHIAVQYVANAGMTDRRCKIRESRQVIFSQVKNVDLKMAYAALNSFVDEFIGANM